MKKTAEQLDDEIAAALATPHPRERTLAQRREEIALAQMQRYARRRGVTLDVTVDDSPYRESHGTSPRGRGDWTFVIGKLHYESSNDPAIYRPAKGLGFVLPYAKAKAHAIAEAKRRGALLVGVAP